MYNRPTYRQTANHQAYLALPFATKADLFPPLTSRTGKLTPFGRSWLNRFGLAVTQSVSGLVKSARLIAFCHYNKSNEHAVIQKGEERRVFIYLFGICCH